MDKRTDGGWTEGWIMDEEKTDLWMDEHLER